MFPMSSLSKLNISTVFKMCLKARVSFKVGDGVELLSKNNVVARGTIHKAAPFDKLHGNILPKVTVGVTVEVTCEEDKIILPFPNPMDIDALTLSSVCGGLIAWPKSQLVSLFITLL